MSAAGSVHSLQSPGRGNDTAMSVSGSPHQTPGDSLGMYSHLLQYTALHTRQTAVRVVCRQIYLDIFLMKYLQVRHVNETLLFILYEI